MFHEKNVFYMEKTKGKDFVILQLTDLHIVSRLHGENTVFPVMKKWVNEVNPDLIVLTGDGINGTADGNDMRALVSFMKELQVPWAYVFGNHEKDAAGGIPAMSAFLSAEAKKHDVKLFYHEGSFTDEDRYGNYVVNVQEEGKIVYSLFFLDSGREYETFLLSQEKWYKEGVQVLSERYFGAFVPSQGKVVPSMIFHHIPTDEYQYAANAVLSENLVVTEENGERYVYQNVKVGQVPPAYGSGENKEFAYGQRDARVKNARIHTTESDRMFLEYAMYEDERSQAGFFDTVKRLRSSTHMFCGHRHSNNASIDYQGITLTFGTKTGTGNFNDDMKTGCTVIIIEDSVNKVEIDQKYDWKQTIKAG